MYGNGKTTSLAVVRARLETMASMRTYPIIHTDD